MTPRRRFEEQAAKAFEILNAHLARHEAQAARAVAAHGRAMEAVERRRARTLAAHHRPMAAIQRRLGGHPPADGRHQPPRGTRYRGEEGGEAVPAVPKPGPNPLAGAAAAPIE